MAAGVGRIFVNAIEALIARLPIVRNVYSAVKQVTDFVFSEREIEFNRVVAVQYPSKGIWSIGFVTGESMLDIRSAANEPVLSVLMPTSPMPATGFTITVRKSETIDLELTVDQAIQFIVSCGVVVPQHQQLNETSAKISEAISRRLQSDGIGSTSATTVRRVVEQPRRSERESDSQPSKNGDGVDPSVQHPPHEPTQNTDADDAQRHRCACSHGTERRSVALQGPIADPQNWGELAACQLLSQGAASLVASARDETVPRGPRGRFLPISIGNSCAQALFVRPP